MCPTDSDTTKIQRDPQLVSSIHIRQFTTIGQPSSKESAAFCLLSTYITKLLKAGVPDLTAHVSAATLNARSVHSPSTSLVTFCQDCQQLSDYRPPSIGYTQGTGNSQVSHNKYAELLVIIEELGKEIRPRYTGSKSSMERLKRGTIHARKLVQECLAETELNARS
ncbi:cyclin-dependent kinase 2-associated protein 1-like [Acomys russatus]|uniref:cyclin-dependent kinase 2-associated protein 1-like n=1 Tax=Acomys russatus TaxID=60746 RepID=UPI0021E30F48|nr:cyclin-dependent kinase 2-associated protein 1-like [Acomys russatus]